MEREYCIVANVIRDRQLRTGAKVFLIGGTGGGPEKRIVVGLSKTGRRIWKWIAVKRLENFRISWCPENFRKEVYPTYLYTKEDGMREAAQMELYYHPQRAYSPDGTLIKQGLPESLIQLGHAPIVMR